MRNTFKRAAAVVAGVLAGTAIVTGSASAHPPAFEDGGSWSCAVNGNSVCGPHKGPNNTDHNVYYGWRFLPYIPGRVTTWPDGSVVGPFCVDPVFVELGRWYPANSVIGTCR